MPGSTRSSVSRGRPRRESRHLVRRAALGLHALAVEQEPRVLGHQPDVADELGGSERPGSRPSTATAPRVGRRTPESVLSSVDLPEPFLPMSASTSPGMIVRSTPSSATTGPYETVSFAPTPPRRVCGERRAAQRAAAA